MTEVELALVEARCAKAEDMVERLCRPRLAIGAREWLLSIPARPDHDPDLVIAAALADVPALVAEVRRLRVTLGRAVRDHHLPPLDGPTGWISFCRFCGQPTWDYDHEADCPVRIFDALDQ